METVSMGFSTLDTIDHTQTPKCPVFDRKHMGKK